MAWVGNSEWAGRALPTLLLPYQDLRAPPEHPPALLMPSVVALMLDDIYCHLGSLFSGWERAGKHIYLRKK